MLKDDIKPEPIDSIRKFLLFGHKYLNRLLHEDETWIFRGLSDSNYDLTTKLERAIEQFDCKMAEAREIEAGLLRRFQRQTHHYLQNTPSPGNYMEWLGLMQHYGAPTRLLDFTYSFFVAAYFAVADAKGECAIWAINSKSQDKKLKKIFREKKDRDTIANDPNLQLYEDFESIFNAIPPKQFAMPMNPYKFNERLVIQQGVFMCPGDICKGFEENLRAPFNKTELETHVKYYKIPNNLILRKNILMCLYRMNMTSATLFPGLQGFAESLRPLLAFPKILDFLPSDGDYVKEQLWQPKK